MKCPNCGMEMESELYTKMKKGSIGVQMVLFCPKGDFMSDSTSPSRVAREVESAYEWTKTKGARNDHTDIDKHRGVKVVSVLR